MPFLVRCDLFLGKMWYWFLCVTEYSITFNYMNTLPWCPCSDENLNFIYIYICFSSNVFVISVKTGDIQRCSVYGSGDFGNHVSGLQYVCSDSKFPKPIFIPQLFFDRCSFEH